MKKIIICTPYFNNIGGTELEALNSAIYLTEQNPSTKVSIFTPKNEIHSFFIEESKKYNIKIFSYPFYFKFFRKTKLFNEFLYWKFISFPRNISFFILGYIPAVYFFPILSLKKSTKVLKVTMNHYLNLPKNQIGFYNKLDKIIVFNEKQKNYWKDIQRVKSEILNLDITIGMEQDLLRVKSLKRTNEFVIGYLGRVSHEKNIEDMIKLVKQLKSMKINIKLIIQGESNSLTYSKKLSNLIQEYGLKENITVNNFFIKPNEVCGFYESIDMFLVTSTSEGGPITALEALAAGRIVVSYDVGAMRERLGIFPLCIVQDLGELIVSVNFIINMENKEFAEFSQKLRNHYIKYLANHNKIKKLNDLILS